MTSAVVVLRAQNTRDIGGITKLLRLLLFPPGY